MRNISGPRTSPPLRRECAGTPGAFHVGLGHFAAFLLCGVVAAACDREPGGDEERRAARLERDGRPPVSTTDSPATTQSPTASDSAADAAVREAFLASREALRRLDVEAFLAGYEEGPQLLVIDPAGEHAGYEAFESYARDWFTAARQGAPPGDESYPVVTARERVRVLDDRTAVLTVDWSAPGGAGPHRSLLLYRRGPSGWHIAAEHSAAIARTDEPPLSRSGERGAAGETEDGSDRPPANP